jgi:deoxyribose-phosphate aldolase
MTTPNAKELAGRIDHTLLKPEATSGQILQLCEEARQYNFWSVCVNPVWVAEAAELLRGTPVKVCTVIGFPLGATSSGAKAAEAEIAVADGAAEVDMVIPVGALKSGRLGQVRSDIQAVVGAVGGGALVKVILETALLSETEKIAACQLTIDAGAQYVKTSTGFGPAGATVADVALMRRIVGTDFGVKASGGIRDLQTALAMIEAGADRIGASAGVKILGELAQL